MLKKRQKNRFFTIFESSGFEKNEEISEVVKKSEFLLLTIKLTAHNGDLERDEEAFDEIFTV